MTGRQEHNNIIEEKIKNKLIGEPEILKDYYYSFTNKTATTKHAYINYVIEFLDYLSKDGKDVDDLNVFKSIKTNYINKYMNEGIKYREKNGTLVENSESIRASKLYGISNFFEFLIDEGIILSNPCDRVKPPRCREEKPIIAMNESEIKILIDNIKNGVGSDRSKARCKKWKNRDIAIITIGCSTGLRVTSITEINISDIDFNNNSIRVREKGNKERLVYIGQNTKRTILKWIEDREDMFGDIPTDALFISEKKNRISSLAIYDLVKKYSVGIEKHITPHKMRSSCATNLYEKTGDIYLVQEVLGHKNISNTMKYAKMADERRIAATSILDNIV